MSSSDTILHPEEKITAGPGVAKAKSVGLAAGLVLLLAMAGWGLALGDGMQRFFHGYLVAFTYFTSIALGALFFVLIMHLMGAKWVVSMRRVAEILTQAFPLLAVLSAVIWLPILLGNDSLYIWTSEEFMDKNHLVHAKGGYLNPVFFAARQVLYFVLWIGISNYFFKTSCKQDEGDDDDATRRMAKWAAPAMFVFAFSCAFFAFDMLMSIEPEWFSTMFGVVYFAGCCISVFALMTLIPLALQRSGRLVHSITVEHYHDIGKLLFAFVFFWGYVAFSQFMLIWGANIPEETGYFLKRWFTGGSSGLNMGEMGVWGKVTLVMLVMHFLIPFILLMSRHSKRKLHILAGFSIWMLAWHYLDLYWQVMPALNNHALWGLAEPSSITKGIGIDFGLWVGMGLLFMGYVAGKFQNINLIPIKDPGLAQSLKFENQ
jgi:hypothetical protein